MNPQFQPPPIFQPPPQVVVNAPPPVFMPPSDAGVAAAVANPIQAFLAAAGVPGACFSEDMLLDTPTGPRKMKDLAVGDYILTSGKTKVGLVYDIGKFLVCSLIIFAFCPGYIGSRKLLHIFIKSQRPEAENWC